MNRCKLLIIAFLAFITNGFSLLGIGNGSIGGVVRAMEANHTITRSIEIAKAMGMLAGNPPHEPESGFFGPFQVDCSVIGMCEVLA